jgi:hypothetical protein
MPCIASKLDTMKTEHANFVSTLGSELIVMKTYTEDDTRLRYFKRIHTKELKNEPKTNRTGTSSHDGFNSECLNKPTGATPAKTWNTGLL